MAFIAEIKEAYFLDEKETADISSIKYCIYDDAADYPVKGFLTYDFLQDKVSFSKVNNLSIVATIKTAIDAIKLDKAKDGTYFTANPLPQVDCIYIKKDGLGNCVSYQEVYKEPQTQESEGASGGGSTGGGGY